MLTPVLLSVPVVLLTVLVWYLVLIAAAAVAGAVARGARRERAVEAYEALAVSRFTIPVSVIVPVSGDADPSISDVVAALEASNYPEFEIIVVCDRLLPEAMARLKDEWRLEAKELFYRRSLATAPVRRLYASAADTRLMIVEKDPAGRADALNCGVNLARYRYVVSVAPEITPDPNALLRLVSPALRDPGTVLAVTSSIERRAESSADDRRRSRQHGRWLGAFQDYQRLCSLRSWMASRLVWFELRGGLPPRESVIAWRRDALLELGGFSSVATDPDLDMVVRLQISRHERASGRVVRSSEVFGQAGPASISAEAALTAARSRALREALHTLWAAPGLGRDRLTLPVMLIVELFTPIVELVVLVGVIVAAAAGLVSWTAPLLAALMLTFGTGVVSACALLVRGGAPDAPVGQELVRLLIRAPLELAVYRPALAWARFSPRG